MRLILHNNSDSEDSDSDAWLNDYRYDSEESIPDLLSDVSEEEHETDQGSGLSAGDH